MLPIVLETHAIAVGLAGDGDGLARRRGRLEDAGVQTSPVSPDASEEALRGLSVLFIAGLTQAQSQALAARARLAGVLVNVEDVPALCDFHVPAMVRRGDLLISVSTGGRAPGLAKVLRRWLERRIGAEWGPRLDEVAGAREAWRSAGHSLAEVSHRTRALVAEKGWLA